ncbi:hypothetical protein GQ55_6G065800 [Panicum hallii var. hallii]|uniref:Uncharacterized protein n=1 Tax=Panicum hallii var. hallii TaxID=1504633 RepID=A0A2T7D4R7_9POAL|nr:hypothetical protein GQ55_6G065800 [Panicum hallii var. hallii]
MSSRPRPVALPLHHCPTDPRRPTFPLPITASPTRRRRRVTLWPQDLRARRRQRGASGLPRRESRLPPPCRESAALPRFCESLLFPCLLALLLLRTVLDPDPDAAALLPLRFRHDGTFKIL